MKYKITAPKRLNANVGLPASKSISNRALIIHALAGGVNGVNGGVEAPLGQGELPQNLSDCDDTNVMVAALGNNPYEIDIKAAGTAMRFLTAYLAVTDGEHVITGTERMKHRPIAVLVDALRYLGADIEYLGEEGYPPLRIRGRELDGGRLEVPGNISSQYISALLMIAPVLRNGLRLHLKGDIISRPYIDLTLCMMKAFGAEADWRDKDVVVVKPQRYSCIPYRVESDWSAASYWYEMMALINDRDSLLLLEGLLDGSRQGDSISRYLFSLLGVKTAFTAEGARLRCSGTHVPRLEYDLVSAPDLAQTFVVCCAEMNVHFHFKGLQTLKIKETDRIEALKVEMCKLGYVLHDVEGRELYWNGERCEPDNTPIIDTYDDHRMALAFAPLAISRGEIIINAPHVVTKSYPHYWEDLRNAGFIVEEI